MQPRKLPAISPVRYNTDPPPEPTYGGVFNAKIIPLTDMPDSLRNFLIEAGAGGIPSGAKVDKDAPTTAAFRYGTQGLNGWYTGPATVTLIATDIDGPSDIASTTYSVDDGGLIPYTAPFTVSGDGVHTVTFGSVDQAGNTETPRPSQTVKIDGTPPTMIATANPSTLWPADGRMVSVNITGTITDNVSGIDPNTAEFWVRDEYGKVQPSGPITINSDGSYSITIQLEAKRDDNDSDGRQYSVVIRAHDNRRKCRYDSSHCNRPA